MAEKKFKFVSPGIFLQEIDNSALPRVGTDLGPVVIGRTGRGPALRPVTVNSFAEFVTIFGEPLAGGKGTDVWRGGDTLAPTYASYAAQAWLRNNSPMTVMRLLGAQSSNASGEGLAGWGGAKTAPVNFGSVAAGTPGGAYGLFVMNRSGLESPSGSLITRVNTPVNGYIFSIQDTNGHVFKYQVDYAGSPSGSSNTLIQAGFYGIPVDSDDVDTAALYAAAIADGLNAQTGSTITATASDNYVLLTGPPGASSATMAVNPQLDGSMKTNLFFASSEGNSAANGSLGSLTAGSGSTNEAATLAAIFYSNNTVTPVLVGTPVSGSQLALASANTSSQGVVFPTNSAGNFVMGIGTQAQIAAETEDRIEFNFNRNDSKYVRQVFNTNPTLLNTEITSGDASRNYFLGESYDFMLQTGSIGDTDNAAGNEEALNTNISSNTNITDAFLVGLAANSAAGIDWSNRAFGTQEPRTGWIVGQCLGEATAFKYDNAQKLFRVHGLNHGEWVQNNLKISIDTIRPSSNDANSYGSFNVVVRRLQDNDKSPVVVERFSNCNLNPNSADYVCRKVGDQHIAWDNTEARIREYGTWPNQSKFIRIEPNSDLDDGALDARYLPFGFVGAPRYLLGLQVSASAAGVGVGQIDQTNLLFSANNDIAAYDATLLTNSGSIFVAKNLKAGPAGSTENAGPGNLFALTASYFMPTVPLRINATDGNMASKQDAYFGVRVGQTDSYNTFDKSIVDALRAPVAAQDPDSNVYQSAPYTFTLDDLSGSAGEGAVYVSGSLIQSGLGSTGGKSLTATYGYGAVLTGSTLDSDLGHIGGFDKFTCLFHGGFDGLDITEKDAFRNNAFITSPTADTDYRFNTVKRAIDTLRDPEFVEFNLATMPGINVESLTSHLLETCEERADAMAIIDLTGDYTPRTENTNTAAQRRPNVAEAVRNLKLRNINSSYGAAYFPWVMIRDTNSNQIVDVPPSVVALGTISNSESKRALWFAPAGFTRGGLSEGAAGLPVVGVKYQLNSKERDNLYEASINPIATFPAEGIVIFGQKTLQVTPSALDRVNVRRLLIYIKKEISRLAATTLFEQNVAATWDKFSNRAESFLSGIKAAQGLTDYRVILDKSTTTPELIDRNIMYAKVFLKPARAIEFVALDFTITDSGASFND